MKNNDHPDVSAVSKKNNSISLFKNTKNRWKLNLFPVKLAQEFLMHQTNNVFSEQTFVFIWKTPGSN